VLTFHLADWLGGGNGWLECRQVKLVPPGAGTEWEPRAYPCQMQFFLKPWNVSFMFKHHARRWCAIVVLCAVSLAAVNGALADDMDDRIAATQNMPDALKNGELVFHGNYCGTGNRAGSDPIDALDLACMRHDACTPTGKVQSCACNARLAKEAGAVARDSRQPAELRSLATLTATAATAGMVLCLPGPLIADRTPEVAPVPPRPIKSVGVPVETPVAIAPPAAVGPPVAIVPSAAVEPSAPAPLAPPLELVAPVEPVAPAPVAPEPKTP